MTRLEHTALWVDDLEKVCSFYEKYLGATIGQLYTNPRKGFSSRFATFESGARLEIMTTSTLTLERPAPGSQRHGLTHIAFSLGSEAAVDELTVRLSSDGHTVLDGPRRTGDGYYESVILDPEGNRVELVA
jgi:lactoylglutathione lyase